MKVLVSAAEISSDIHAEKIIRSLIELNQSKGLKTEVIGIGGPRLRSIPGFQSIEPAENLRTMGFVEVFRKWSYFKDLIAKTADRILSFQPDLILTFDYPDFHFRLMERILKVNASPNALRICCIPPKVWVWRSHRVEKIRNLYHGVWVIFPFEKKFYEDRSIPVIYEGNPLLEKLPVRDLKALQKETLETITVMPGSRESELEHHLRVIPQTLEKFSEKIGHPIKALVPVPDGVEPNHLKSKLIDTTRVHYEWIENDSASCLRRTSIGLIKSGTSTLESSVLDCIPVIFYKMNPISEMIFNLIIRRWGGYLGPVGLPNILLESKTRLESPFQEFLGVEATPEQLSNHLFRLYSDEKLRSELIQKCGKIRSQFFLEDGQANSSDRSAVRILDWMNRKPIRSYDTRKSPKLTYGLVSFLWSSLNYLRRKIRHWGWFKIHQVKTPSILVGNLQAGGSGKTPLIIALAKAAMNQGKRVAIISRGYGADENHPLGDEPMEILNAVPGVEIHVGADRLKSISKAESSKVDLILFDDGFQNLQFKAKTTILAVTAWGRSEVPYRDFDGESKYADWIIGTKGAISNPKFKDHKNFIPIQWEWNQHVDQPVWILCAIADPDELRRFYEQRGLIIKKMVILPDHATLNREEVKKLIHSAKEEGCLLAVTPKDAVKLGNLIKEVFVLTRSIKNQEWIEKVFASTLD